MFSRGTTSTLVVECCVGEGLGLIDVALAMMSVDIADGVFSLCCLATIYLRIANSFSKNMIFCACCTSLDRFSLSLSRSALDYSLGTEALSMPDWVKDLLVSIWMISAWSAVVFLSFLISWILHSSLKCLSFTLSFG